MSSPASYLSQPSVARSARPHDRQAHPGETAPTALRTVDQLALFQSAVQIMATGALTDDQAKTLSRQLLASVG